MRKSIVKEKQTGALYRVESVADGTVTLKEAVLLDGVYVLAPVPQEKRIQANVLEHFFDVVAKGQPETPDVQSFSVRGGSLYYKDEQVETGYEDGSDEDGGQLRTAVEMEEL